MRLVTRVSSLIMDIARKTCERVLEIAEWSPHGLIKQRKPYSSMWSEDWR